MAQRLPTIYASTYHTAYLHLFSTSLDCSRNDYCWGRSTTNVLEDNNASQKDGSEQDKTV